MLIKFSKRPKFNKFNNQIIKKPNKFDNIQHSKSLKDLLLIENKINSIQCLYNHKKSKSNTNSLSQIHNMKGFKDKYNGSVIDKIKVNISIVDLSKNQKNQSMGINGKCFFNHDIINIKEIAEKNTGKKHKNKHFDKKPLTLRINQEIKKFDFEQTTYDKIYTSKEKTDIHLAVPLQFQIELNKPDLIFVPPSENKPGNYSNYVEAVANSLRNFIDLDYGLIFNKKNDKNNVYCSYKSQKKLLLLDLDETLIHSKFRTTQNYKELDLIKKDTKCTNKIFKFEDEDFQYCFDVYFRPYLFDFLNDIKKYFDLGIFTAARKTYADTIIDYIDPKKEIFKFRIYRNACISIKQTIYIKDLRILKNYDLKDVILLDNSLYSFMNQLSNGVLINSFYIDDTDKHLLAARNYLVKYLYNAEDVRVENNKWFNFKGVFSKKKDNCN